MANYAEKLANMRARRKGFDSIGVINKSVSFAEDSVNLVEAYESRGTTEAVKYALGAMQALDASDSLAILICSYCMTDLLL